MTIARKLRVTGRVQGVFYRAWAQQQARELGVSGWVRNRPDGSVEAHLEGEEAAVAELIGRLRSGPPDARVRELRSRPVDPEDCGGFDIRS